MQHQSMPETFFVQYAPSSEGLQVESPVTMVLFQIEYSNVYFHVLMLTCIILIADNLIDMHQRHHICIGSCNLAFVNTLLRQSVPVLVTKCLLDLRKLCHSSVFLHGESGMQSHNIKRENNWGTFLYYWCFNTAYLSPYEGQSSCGSNRNLESQSSKHQPLI